MSGAEASRTGDTWSPHAAGLGALHLLALSSLAFAQPLLDLLGRGAEFFVAHHATPGDLVLLVLGLVVGPALPAIATSLLAFRLRASVGRAVLAGWIGLFFACAALPFLHRLTSPPGWLVLALAAVFGAAAGWGYHRSAALRSFTSALCLALVAVPALFFAKPQIRALLAPASELPPAAQAARIESDTPVYFLLFDELSLASLLDAPERIDGERFPNFARLAATSTWFRDTAAVSDVTEYAVPAILSGRFPERGSLPTLEDHPRNLFTLFAHGHRIWSHEPITQLCPPGVNRAVVAPEPRSDRLRAISADLRLVYLHLVLPPSYAERLPPVSHTWGSFAGDREEEAPPVEAARGNRPIAGKSDVAQAALRALHGNRRAQFEELLRSIDGAGDSGLTFDHVLLPHFPWEFLPSGHVYATDSASIPGLSHERWLQGARWATLEAEKRYLLQLMFLDRLIGRFLDRLAAQGVLDRALVVVSADHGVSFRPGDSRRPLTRSNEPDILPVPLFVKAPGQRQGRVVDAPVNGLDILPTILDVLGTSPPWPLDGRSLLDPALPPTRERRVLSVHRGLVELHASLLPELAAAVARTQALFGHGADLDRIYRAGVEPELYGRRLDELSVERTAGVESRIEGGDLFADVDPSDEHSLSFVKGRIEGVAEDSCCEIAVAVDGTIRATTRTSTDAAGRRRFSALVPESSLRRGRNSVEALVVRHRVDGWLLLGDRRPSPEEFRFERAPDGRVTALVSPWSRLPVEPGAILGRLDQVGLEGDRVELLGWAVDLSQARPADNLLVFLGGSLVYSGAPLHSRGDVANALGNPALAACGFRVGLAADRIPGWQRKGLRFFGVSASGKAGEIPAHYALERIGNLLHVTNDHGLDVAVGTGEVPVGRILATQRKPRGYEVAGWALDPAAKLPVAELLVIRDGEILAVGRPTFERPEIARRLGVSPQLAIGFRFMVPHGRMRGVDPAELSLLAVAESGGAGRLEWAPGAR